MESKRSNRKEKPALRRICCLLPMALVEQIEREAEKMTVPNCSVLIRETLAQRFSEGSGLDRSV